MFPVSREIAANGLTLAFDERGDGPPIVLIMGIAAQSIFWPEALCDRLAERGFRVIRFDNRDVGRSSYLDHLGVPDVRAAIARRFLGLPIAAPYTLSDMAADVAGLIDGLDLDRAHIVGASLGGMIAQHVAIEHPAKVRSLTSIMSSPGDLASLLAVHPRSLRAFLARPPTDHPTYVERIVTTFRTNAGRGFPFDEPGMRDLADRAFARGFHPEAFPRQLTAALASGDRRARLRTVTAPTLVLHGTDDPLVGLRAGRAVAEAIAGARFVALDGMGHDLPAPLWGRIADAIADHAIAA